jgi:hypothetical protein
MILPKQLRQPRDVDGDPPGLVFGQQVGGIGRWVRPRLILDIIGAVGPRDGCHTSEGSAL